MGGGTLLQPSDIDNNPRSDGPRSDGGGKGQDTQPSLADYIASSYDEWIAAVSQATADKDAYIAARGAATAATTAAVNASTVAAGTAAIKATAQNTFNSAQNTFNSAQNNVTNLQTTLYLLNEMVNNGMPVPNSQILDVQSQLASAIIDLDSAIIDLDSATSALDAATNADDTAQADAAAKALTAQSATTAAASAQSRATESAADALTAQERYNNYMDQQDAQVPICFNKGTKILCLNSNSEEEYVAIENLKKGGLVKTLLHGYKKLDLIATNKLINNPNTKTNCMYILEATETNGLTEDLILTGGHGLMVDKLSDEEQEIQKKMGFEQMVNGKHLLLACVSNDFKKVKNTNIHTYYHFILENDGDDNNDRYGVYANGVLVETPAKSFFVGCCNNNALHLLHN